jgi:hypothetical protein
MAVPHFSLVNFTTEAQRLHRGSQRNREEKEDKGSFFDSLFLLSVILCAASVPLW